jgi:hypothetical protein
MAKHVVDLDDEALGAARAELGKRLGHAGVRGAIEHLAIAGASARPTIRDLEIGYSARIAQRRPKSTTYSPALQRRLRPHRRRHRPALPVDRARGQC